MDKFVCEGCGQTSQVKLRSCPGCGEAMINIEEGIEDRYEEDEEPDTEPVGRDEFDLEADLAI